VNGAHTQTDVYDCLCLFSVLQYESVLNDCNQALSLEFHNVKALFRRAQAYKVQLLTVLLLLNTADLFANCICFYCYCVVSIGSLPFSSVSHYLVLALDSQHIGRSVPSVQSTLVDEEKMRLGH